MPCHCSDDPFPIQCVIFLPPVFCKKPPLPWFMIGSDPDNFSNSNRATNFSQSKRLLGVSFGHDCHFYGLLRFSNNGSSEQWAVPNHYVSFYFFSNLMDWDLHLDRGMKKSLNESDHLFWRIAKLTGTHLPLCPQEWIYHLLPCFFFFCPCY